MKMILQRLVTALLFSIVAVSTSFAQTWVAQNSGTTESLRGIAFADAYMGIIVGDNGTVLRTTNSGTDWVAQTSGTSVMLRGVSFVNANTGTVVGNGGTVLRTTNGGIYWITQTSGITAHLYGVSFLDEQNGIAVGDNGKIIRTTDGGTTWAEQTSGVSVTLRSINFLDVNSAAIVGDDGLIIRTTDGGANWVQQVSGTAEVLLSGSFTNPQIGTAVGFNGTILRTTNGGTDWVGQTSGLEGQLWSVHLRDANNGTTVGSGGTILSTTDGGENWLTQTSGVSTTLYSVFFTDANNGTAVGASGTILRYDPQFPQAPTYLSLEGAEYFGMYLYWDDNSNNETGFKIERKDGALNSSLPWVLIDSVGTDINYYYDDSLLSTSTYSYRVCAYNEFGNSAYCDPGERNTLGWWLQPMIMEYWTGSTDGTTKTDGEINTVYPNVGWAVFDTRSFYGDVTIVSMEFYGYVNNIFSPSWSATPMGSINPVTDNAANIKDQIINNYTSDVAYIYTHGPQTTGWYGQTLGNNAITDFRIAQGQSQGQFAIGFVEWDFLPDHYINFDGWSPPNAPWLRIICRSGGSAPLAPSNLIAVADTHFVELSWDDNSNNEIGFKIERKDGALHIPGTWVLIDSVSSLDTVFIDTGLTPQTIYSYRIYAYNQFGNSDYSDSVEVETILPVELTSFTATVNGNTVNLNWSTATEINNRGFEVERKAGNWKKVGFVEGNGTTTEIKSYSFTDINKTSGSYSYRLKQIDYDGTYSYSNEVEAEIGTPKEYSLEQNYPNPFNPSTSISFSIPNKSSVQLSIFNILGEKVDEPINDILEAGVYNFNWNATGLSSGIYVYQLKMGNVQLMKKMTLMK